ncbi:MAG TPA: zinc-binding alcohol dehydrogenase family protein [Roseiarcus sp.]|nr:zinc-binding alcohol dehydrogenase family protein [Roseiarcus sp.]
MRAIGYRKASPELDHLEAFDIPKPSPEGRDLLVEVRAVSVNPVDYKVASGGGPGGAASDAGAIKVVGYDAAGVVVETGREAQLFKPGDEVFYAGSVGRQGANMQFHLVDERIVGRKPCKLDFAAAAALPLTSITAWEAMFDRLDVAKPVPGAARAILILGGAGGVGSIAIQLARQLTDLTIVATASRPETVQWAKDMGAHHVVDHKKALAPQIAALGMGSPGFIFATSPIGGVIADLAELIAPQGRVALINGEAADLFVFRPKSVSIHFELMFTRPLLKTADIEAQHMLLNEVADLVDSGRVRSTMRENYGRIDAANLMRAMAFLKSGRAIGKVVLAGF